MGKITNIDENLVREMYLERKMKVKEIAEYFSVSVFPIKKILKGYTNRRNLSERIKKEDLYDMYFVKNMSLTKIAEIYNVSDVAIGGYFRDFGFSATMGRKEKNLDIEEIVRLYDEGISCEKISKTLGVSNRTISSRVSEYREIRETSFYVSGEKCHLWRGGQSIDDRWNVEYRSWRKCVFERDSYTCQKCGDNKGGNLNAHHILNYSEHENLRYEVSNGITLCEKCHSNKYENSFHRIYGMTNNTKEQLEEFLGREID